MSETKRSVTLERLQSLVNGIKGYVGGLLSDKADKTDTVLINSLSLGRKDGSNVGKNSVAVGLDNIAKGQYSLANGARNEARGGSSHAEGMFTITAQAGAHAEGFYTYAEGTWGSHAEGCYTIATGPTAHSDGVRTAAVGDTSSSRGQGGVAYGNFSTVGGNGYLGTLFLSGNENATTYNYVYPSGGAFSFDEGCVVFETSTNMFGLIKAIDNENHTITLDRTLGDAISQHGFNVCGNVASGWASNAIGLNVRATGGVQNVFGMYNHPDTVRNAWEKNTHYNVGDIIQGDAYSYRCVIENTDSTFDVSKWERVPGSTDNAIIVGNGIVPARSNAYALSWSGDGHYAGNVYVNCDSDSTGGSKLVSETDYPSSTKSGVVKISDSYGIYKTGDNTLRIWAATDTLIKEGTNAYRPLVPSKQHQSVFYGLAKAAGHDESESALEIGTYSDTAKTAIQNMLGVQPGIEVVRLI